MLSQALLIKAVTHFNPQVISGLLQMFSANSAKSLCQKISTQEEKMKMPLQTITK